MDKPNPEQLQVLWDLIKDIRFAMFTTRHADGHLHSRPMTTQNKALETDANLWFFMPASSEPATDIAVDPAVNLAYAHPGNDQYVSVAGIARVVDDLAMKQALWSKFVEAWFPGGPADPGLALVQVAITHAEYWEVTENKLVQLFALTRSAFTGNPPTDLGTHGEVRVR